MTHDTGGPAKDKTLLDWFAGQVATGDMVQSGDTYWESSDAEKFARRCYTFAAVMIAEKRRREASPPSGPSTTSNGQGGGE